ncbi:MAG: pyridoxamine 5'-phosphate oxidase family protein, partial [Bifidobacteriaceae bacterium]|nr:pyridoxamine 5'-phosphate oxidase family protein [Bifidobacteriaceae bacterium]
MIHLRVSAEVAPVTSALLLESVERILATNRLCTLATVNGDQTPHASTAFFAPIDTLGVAIWTSPRTRHSVNAEANPAAALTVFDSNQPFGQPLLGLQA